MLPPDAHQQLLDQVADLRGENENTALAARLRCMACLTGCRYKYIVIAVITTVYLQPNYASVVSMHAMICKTTSIRLGKSSTVTV